MMSIAFMLGLIGETFLYPAHCQVSKENSEDEIQSSASSEFVNEDLDQPVSSSKPRRQKKRKNRRKRF